MSLNSACADASVPANEFDPAHIAAALRARVEAACAQACRTIAPSWPLDQSIAVNPHWQRIGQPLRTVAARMAALGGIRVFPPRDLVREAWRSGRIEAQDLDAALATLAPPELDAAACIAALDEAPPLPRLPLLIDLLDDDPLRHTRLSWRQAITHQVSQTCAAYFDQHQADWQPQHGRDLYAFWRNTLMHDHGIGTLMGLPQIGKFLRALPETRAEAETWVLQRLGLPEAVWPAYLEAVLLTVNGWASWCAYLAHQDRQTGQDNDAYLRDLLAIRLAWGRILLECKDDTAAAHAFPALQAAWVDAPARLARAEDMLRVDEVWQLALDLGYQRELAQRLATAATPLDADAHVEVQAAFCIDVRSERLRRALEAAWPGIRTIGCAGFFGLPIAYTPLATQARRPQLPGLLAPALETTEELADTGAGADANGTASAIAARRRRFALASQLEAAWRWPGAAFSSVEAAGLGYLGQLARWLRPAAAARPRDELSGLPQRYRARLRPTVAGLDVAGKAALAARILRSMGLDRRLAPLVLLVGHGSQSCNNAHAAALDCGACCGQSGEINARVVAGILNDAGVRAALLADHDIGIPEWTTFVAALHNTTTDEIEGFDLDLLPEAARTRWTQLQPVLAQASDQVRRERAPRLGLDARLPHANLLDQLRRRANDGAQTRPEWGLAGNAAFLIAPRRRSQGVMLDGRSFLHDYDATQDADGSLLEQLMTAPMLVAHWINWQYHASTCAPERLGSGNKVLHNVVGGRIGVFEGNGGDLRIGLSRQSLHDGERWQHEPLRLTVVIDAPPESIQRVIARHATVRHLVDNGWLHLWRFEGAGLQRYAGNRWLAVSPAEVPAS